MTATAWQRKLLTAGACALLGVLVDLARPVLGVQVATVGLGIGLIGASFLLAWAADAGETVFHGGLVLAVIALLTVLPEFVIEVRFAYAQQTELVTANLTGATRLLLTGAIGLPLAVACIARRRHQAAASLELAAPRRLELGDPADHVDLRDPDRRPREPDGVRRRHPRRALRPLRAPRAGHAGVRSPPSSACRPASSRSRRAIDAPRSPP